MAKFCANCGSQMDHEDKVCGQCGTPVAGANVSVANVSVASQPSDNEKNGKDGNKVVKLIAAAIVLVVVAVIAANVVGNFTGYKGTLNKMVKALQNNDVAALESLSSSISDEIYGSWYGDDLYDYYEEAVSDTLDKYEDSVGAVKKISYEISDEIELSDRRLEEFEDYLIDMFNMDVSNIKKIKEVQLKLTVKGAKKSSTYNVSNLYLVKESGGWKIYYGDLIY